MCGRYAMSLDAGDINNAFAKYDLNVKEVRDSDKQYPTYNVGPTKYAPIYRKDKEGDSIIQYATWGLIPFWTKKKEDANQYKTFNARKESVISGQRLWTPVRKHSRCVVPIEGYYEWLHKPIGQTKKVDKIPYYLRRKDKKLIFLAGLYDNVHYEDTGDEFQSFTIITGPAPKQTKWLHERMPIVLEPGTKEWDLWLDNTKEWDDSFGDALKEYGKDDLEWYEVSKDVGKVTNDGDYLVKPVKKGGIGDFFGKNKKEDNSKKVKEEENDKSKKGDIKDMLKDQNVDKKEEEETVKHEEEEVEEKGGDNDELKDQAADGDEKEKPVKQEESLEDDDKDKPKPATSADEDLETTYIDTDKAAAEAGLDDLEEPDNAEDNDFDAQEPEVEEPEEEDTVADVENAGDESNVVEELEEGTYEGDAGIDDDGGDDDDGDDDGSSEELEADADKPDKRIGGEETGSKREAPNDGSSVSSRLRNKRSKVDS